MAQAISRKNELNSGQQDNRLTLVRLLEEDQPYKKFGQLEDSDVAVSANDEENDKIRRIQGSLVGLAVGDALGASVEFRPYSYLKENPVSDMQSGGTWGLELGQWTDDTSMALCLAASLIVKGGFNAYDQFVRYRKWYREGYMSSTGKCFDIGKSTREAITAFENRWQKVRSQLNAKNRRPNDDYDAQLEYEMCSSDKGLKFGTSDSAGNGPLMRLAPIPCFFHNSYDNVKKCIEEATQLTHRDPKATHACQFYAGLIWHAIDGTPKNELLAPKFYRDTLKLTLHPDIKRIAEGSYKKRRGYDDGIRGKGYIVNALEAALWAFDNDNDNFNEGVLLAVNLGDDTDTTAAIYGELAGAVYGIEKIRSDWVVRLYEGKFIKTVAKGLYVKGEKLRSNLPGSDWSGPTNSNHDKCEGSGGAKTRVQSQPGTTTTSNSQQNTNANNTKNRTDKNNTDNTGHRDDSSSIIDPLEKKDGPNIISQPN